MPCTYCNTQFTLIKWKIRCNHCSKNFCSQCVFEDNCKSCNAVHSTNLHKVELMKLKVKDLRLYLQSRNYKTENYIEKGEMVKKIQLRFGINELDLANHTDSYSNTQYSRTRLENDRTNHETNMDWENVQVLTPPSYNATQHSYPTAQEFTTSATTTTTTRQENTTTENNAGTRTRVSQATTTGTNQSNKNQPSKLSSIKSAAEIKTLSVKQLKTLLKDNMVDFTGVLEKKELINKVVNLFEDNQKNQDLIDETVDGASASSSGNTNQHSSQVDENSCKICWDAPVDCVFLQCGHMATCIGCSKHLTECPICRQHIIRRVRVFKS